MEPVVPITCEEDLQRWPWERLKRERQLLAREISARESAAIKEFAYCSELVKCEGDTA